MGPSPPQPQSFTVGWISPLPIERAAAEQVLDEIFEGIEQHHQTRYLLGRIDTQHVVIGWMPAGRIGLNPAATIAAQMQADYPSVQHRFLVGIGGGVPSPEADVRLGDVVISIPYKDHGGVVRYNAGKVHEGGRIERTGYLSPPPTVLLEVVNDLRARRIGRKDQMAQHLARFDAPSEFAREHAGDDVLFQAGSSHVSGLRCDSCDPDQVVARPARADPLAPFVHYGTIASDDQVIKDGITRDRLSAELGGVLCFEMEAAGLMNDFPCLVIRGICDYADSHKNKSWQPYAAATAAACAKEIVRLLPAPPVDRAPTVELPMRPPTRTPISIFPVARDAKFVDRGAVLDEMVARAGTEPRAHVRDALVGIGGIG